MGKDCGEQSRLARPVHRLSVLQSAQVRGCCTDAPTGSQAVLCFLDSAAIPFLEFWTPISFGLPGWRDLGDTGSVTITQEWC